MLQSNHWHGWAKGLGGVGAHFLNCYRHRAHQHPVWGSTLNLVDMVVRNKSGTAKVTIRFRVRGMGVCMKTALMCGTRMHEVITESKNDGLLLTSKCPDILMHQWNIWWKFSKFQYGLSCKRNIIKLILNYLHWICWFCEELLHIFRYISSMADDNKNGVHVPQSNAKLCSWLCKTKFELCSSMQ